MAIADQLDHLRGQFAGCDVLALTDIETGMVLCTSADRKMPQEQLDDLCATAVSLLGGAVAAGPSDFADQPTSLAILVAGPRVEVFLRAAPPATEALCGCCSPSIDIGAFVQRVKVVLADISAGP